MGYLTVIGVYAPEEGKKRDSERFYEDLNKEVNKYVKSNHIAISGDLNARVGKIPMNYYDSSFYK